MTKGIYKKLLVLRAAVGAIAKNSTNAMQRYKFRGIEATLLEFRKGLDKAGLVLEVSYSKPEVDTFGKFQTVTTLCTLTLIDPEDGSSVQFTTVGHSFDTSDKAANKAMSYAYKYAVWTGLAVPTQEWEEGDFDSPELEEAEKAQVQQKSPPQKSAPLKSLPQKQEKMVEGLEDSAEIAAYYKAAHNVKAEVWTNDVREKLMEKYQALTAEAQGNYWTKKANNHLRSLGNPRE